jgi:branched-subunit amino acid ABC-type transport system permease component
MTLFIEQCLNGLQFGLLLFLLAAGLTLVFGIMDLVNLAHGSLYMIGAYFAATFAAWTGSFVFGAVLALGAALAGLAGLMQAPILTVQIGMGENILILAFVITVIGGIGSIRGAFVAAILVGFIDTVGRSYLPDLLRMVLSTNAAATAAPALSSMLIYLLMAVVLVIKPQGLFSASGK